MKTALVLASVMSTAASDCRLSASFKTLSVSGTIPSTTTISDACCGDLQYQITKWSKGNIDEPPQTSPQEQSQLMQHCQSFAGFMMQWKQQQMSTPEAGPYAHIPSGFEFKESVSGGGATACTLHQSEGNARMSCDIPESTTISADCCGAVQKGLDNSHRESTQQEEMQLKQDMMLKCQSVMTWGQQRMGKVGPPPPKREMIEWLNKALPAGMSCTEKTGSGTSRSMLKAMFAVLEISTQHDMQEFDAQPASPPMFLTVFVVAGIAGAFGGLVALIALKKRPSKPERIALISDDA